MRVSCFMRLTCLRMPLDFFFVFPVLVFSAILSTPYSVVGFPGTRLRPLQDRLAMGLEETLEPGLDLRAGCFLASQLGGDLPVGDPLPAFTDQELRIGPFPFGRILDNGVPGDLPLTMRACNFIVHAFLLPVLFT